MATVEFIITSPCPCPCLRPPPTPPTSGMFLLLRFGIIIISHTRRHCRSHLVRRRRRLHNRQQLITSANVTCRLSIAYSLCLPRVWFVVDAFASSSWLVVPNNHEQLKQNTVFLQLRWVTKLLCMLVGRFYSSSSVSCLA